MDSSTSAIDNSSEASSCLVTLEKTVSAPPGLVERGVQSSGEASITDNPSPAAALSLFSADYSTEAAIRAISSPQPRSPSVRSSLSCGNRSDASQADSDELLIAGKDQDPPEDEYIHPLVSSFSSLQVSRPYTTSPASTIEDSSYPRTHWCVHSSLRFAAV